MIEVFIKSKVIATNACVECIINLHIKDNVIGYPYKEYDNEQKLMRVNEKTDTEADIPIVFCSPRKHRAPQFDEAA